MKNKYSFHLRKNVLAPFYSLVNHPGYPDRITDYASNDIGITLDQVKKKDIISVSSNFVTDICYLEKNILITVAEALALVGYLIKGNEFSPQEDFIPEELKERLHFDKHEVYLKERNKHGEYLLIPSGKLVQRSSLVMMVEISKQYAVIKKLMSPKPEQLFTRYF